MARTGSGTSWADPKLYDNWNDLYAAMSGTAGEDYVGLTDPHLTMDDEFTGEGDGTENNPYVVSTYREMLTVTGASDIWRCRLSDADADLTDLTQPRHYWYNNGVRTIWCLYDPTPTTIDLNDIYPSGTGTLYIEENGCDFNGWTILNLVSTGTADGGIFYALRSDRKFRNLILANAKWTPSSGAYAYMWNVNTEDSILQIDANNSYAGNMGLTYSTSYGYGFTRNSLYWKVRGTGDFSFYLQSGTFSIVDSIIELDVSVNGVNGVLNAGLGLNRCLVKGKVYYNTTNNGGMFYKVEDSIIDVDVSDSSVLQRPVSTCVRSVYNKTKIANWSDKTGLTGVTSEQLLSPTALQAAGLSIGVDT